MTYHVDFTLGGPGRSQVQFTAPREVMVRLASQGGEASFHSGQPAAEHALPAGTFRATAAYRLAPDQAWVPMDVDLIEDTTARAVLRASAYVGSTITAGAGGSTKLEAIVTVLKG